MSVHIFVGPTLSREEVCAELEGCHVFGPVAFGDVYRSVQAGARVIAIVDGYFERVPAVWHKEILFAMSEGVHVFGASSMGALRAAELADFGMKGVGAIYEAYRSGALEDDDEVTLAHGTAEQGFVPLSEALVDIRATLLAGVAAGVVSPATADAVIAAAKERFYMERSVAAAMQDATSQGASRSELEALRAWLPTGRVDQKAQDARQLLSELREWLRADHERMRVSYRLEPTDAWLEARRVADASGETALLPATSGQDALEEELKIAGVYQAALDCAAARAFAIEESRRAGFRPDAPAVGHAGETVRGELGLVQRGDFETWCARQGLDRRAMLRFFEEQALVLWSRPRVDAHARTRLVDGLRASGRYGEFAERAERKQRLLSDFGPRGPSLADLRIGESELWSWFFRTRGHEMPDDLSRFARGAGFADKDAMRSALLRELYCERAGRDPRAAG